jgi:ABC-2 type transport system permease protein
VRHIISAALAPSTWDKQSSMQLLVTVGYTIVFAFMGIKWFRWNTR